MSAVPVDRGPPPNAGQGPTGQPTRNRNRRGRGRGQAPPRQEDTNDGLNMASEPPHGGASSRHRNRNRRGQRPGQPTPSGGNPEHQLPPHMAADAPDDGASVAESTGSNTQRRRGRGNRGQGPPAGRSQPARGRRENFGARLTSNADQVNSTVDPPTIPPPPPTSGDLTSRLIYSLTHKEDAVDCPICFNPVHPAQPIWSCAPAPATPLDDPSAAPSTCCWTIFHMRCIKQWAQKLNALSSRNHTYAFVLALWTLRQADYRHHTAVGSLVRGSGRIASTLALWPATPDPALLVS
ncbi:shuttle craft protein [Ceratobasidium sp. AG-Ba]|nr:shuttle craft protein [Ceratobasidium sp. AG-Ba]QRW02735.1 shuttle craft protein [Ceratobasidium sp. AG-Ba]